MPGRRPLRPVPQVAAEVGERDTLHGGATGTIVRPAAFQFEDERKRPAQIAVQGSLLRLWENKRAAEANLLARGMLEVRRGAGSTAAEECRSSHQANCGYPSLFRTVHRRRCSAHNVGPGMWSSHLLLTDHTETGHIPLIWERDDQPVPSWTSSPLVRLLDIHPDKADIVGANVDLTQNAVHTTKRHLDRVRPIIRLRYTACAEILFVEIEIDNFRRDRRPRTQQRLSDRSNC